MKPSAAVNTAVVATAVALMFLSGIANSQAVFRGHYEIRISWGSSASRATWSYEVAAGETVEIDLDGNSILASVQPVSDRDYDLQVAVKHDPGNMSMAMVAPISTKMHRAAYGESVELTESSDAVTLPGGVIISVLRLWE